MQNGISAAQHLLRAAAGLKQPFGLNELIVAAWEANRAMFGLAGFEKLHPDSNRATVAIVGARGLIAKGMLFKVKPKTYRLTDKGREELTLAQNGKRHAMRGLLPLASRRLVKLLTMQAFSRYLSDPEYVSFGMAAAFTALKPAETIEAARKAVVGECVAVDGGSVTVGQLDLLDVCREALMRRFPKLRPVAAVRAM